MAHSTERFIVLSYVSVGQTWDRVPVQEKEKTAQIYPTSTTKNLAPQQQEIYRSSSRKFTRAAAGILAVQRQEIQQSSSRKFTRAAAGNLTEQQQEIYQSSSRNLSSAAAEI
jgi:hypothetical protein